MSVILLLLVTISVTAFGLPRVEYCAQYFGLDSRVRPGEEDVVRVHRDGPEGVLSTDFQRTNRSLAELRAIYGPELDAVHLHHKRVLDVACGGGRFVRELRAEDSTVDIVGVDLHLDDSQLAEPLRFVQGDALDLPFADGAFDVVVHTQGPLQYYGWDSATEKTLWWRALSESLRVTSPGGTTLVSAVTPYVHGWLSQLSNDYRIDAFPSGTYRLRRHAR